LKEKQERAMTGFSLCENIGFTNRIICCQLNLNGLGKFIVFLLFFHPAGGLAPAG